MWNEYQLALLREAGIAGNSISSGLTAIRKANYATPGLYAHAFFSLSIGLERMLKLIYVLDYLSDQHKFPTEKEFRDLGHDIDRLLDEVEVIRRKHRAPDGGSSLEQNSIEIAIVLFLCRFAKGSRYYNLNLLAGGPAAARQNDPIKDWMDSVGSLVLKHHLTPKREQKIRWNATIIGNSVGHIMHVAHTAEDGRELRDAYSASYETGITEIVRRYGTFYAARLFRNLYYLLWHMRIQCHSAGEAVPYLDELFFPFMNDDAYLLSRKTFPPRSQ